jgi:hypothetical protein
MPQVETFRSTTSEGDWRDSVGTSIMGQSGPLHGVCLRERRVVEKGDEVGLWCCAWDD